jgi:SAM-dependent methyltransferase
LPFADRSFDLIVCFEAIEHTSEPGRALDELQRVARPDGMLLISSPNREVYRPNDPNPYHVHEYVPEELEHALRDLFSNVTLYRQHSHVLSLIGDDETLGAADPSRDILVQFRKLAGRSPGQELYTLAAASDRDLPLLNGIALAGAAGDLEAVNDLQKELGRVREQAQALHHEAKHAYEVLDAFRQTRRYRLAQALSRPIDTLRRRKAE